MVKIHWFNGEPASVEIKDEREALKLVKKLAARKDVDFVSARTPRGQATYQRDPKTGKWEERH